jgi:uncharacterized protein YdhG (YjbR/CyaY superfamily)
MATKRATPTSIDDYIAGFAPDVQVLLQNVRQMVGRAAPDATEVISYQIPAFKLNGVLVYFAAFKNHIGFYPPVKGDVRLQEAAAPYAGDKGNLRFPFTQPLPLDLIERITTLRVKQDRAKATSTSVARVDSARRQRQRR